MIYRWVIDYSVRLINGTVIESSEHENAAAVPVRIRATKMLHAIVEAEEYLTAKYRTDPEVAFWQITSAAMESEK